jgi:hypothetical protein
MPALTKTQFRAAYADVLAGFPTVAEYVRAGDQRVLAQLDAQATMLAMVSANTDVAKFEPFVKARDATVLADAALKGILPLGRAARITLALQNSDTQAVAVGAGRIFLDAKGRVYELDAAVTIAAGATVNARATQFRRRLLTNRVTTASNFYRMQISLSSDELFLNSLAVSKGSEAFTYAPDWFNVEPDQKSYQVEVDELRKMFVCFGRASVVGYGVQQGDDFTIDITECNGRIVDLTPGSAFNLEYILTPQDVAIKAQLVSVQDEGAAPATMSELRVMARYPAIYDHNAVYLGEFGLLLRRFITGIRFLAVWNEQAEEKVRGASVNNINKLFVSGLVSGMTDAEFRARAESLIHRADNSYGIKHVAAVPTAVPVTITASVAISWDRASVESQIRSLILANFGDGSVLASQGMTQPIKVSALNRLLRENVDALRDERADYRVTVTLPTTLLPEQFLHVSAASLSVTVASNGYGDSLWNA